MKFKIFSSLIFLIFLEEIKFCHSVQMNCTYQTLFAMKIGELSCGVKNFHTNYEDRKVTKVIGNNEFKEIKENVTSINIVMEDCPFLPLEIENFFPNIVLLEVRKSNVQHLMSGDLDGYDHLKYLDLSDNPIEQIGHDFFRGAFSIEVIYLYNCNLKKIDPDAFVPLIVLKTLLLKENECIDKNFYKNGVTKLSISFGNIIRNALIENCQGDHYQLKPQFKEKCERKVEASDSSFLDTFIIITLVSLAIILMILTLLLIYTYRIVFKENWSQMKHFFK